MILGIFLFRLTREFALLYSGFIFSSISDSLWSFAIIFVLERLGGIQLVAVNQLVESVVAIFLNAFIGDWIGRHDRLYG